MIADEKKVVGVCLEVQQSDPFIPNMVELSVAQITRHGIVHTDNRADIHVTGQRLWTSVRISVPCKHLLGYPYGHPCGCQCRIIHAHFTFSSPAIILTFNLSFTVTYSFTHSFLFTNLLVIIASTGQGDVNNLCTELYLMLMKTSIASEHSTGRLL